MNSNKYIDERVIEVADYIIKTNATYRLAGEKFKIGKSTAHKYMTERLRNLNYEKYKMVKIVANYNISQRSKRGGRGLRKKWEELKVMRNE